jgi:hypothetical protein
MVKVIVINRHGDLKVANYEGESDTELYKIAGAKKATDFKLSGNWQLENTKGKLYNYCVYGSIVGKANYENKYEFPPPIDNVLFFNSCIVAKKKNDTLKSLTVEEWEDIYDTLYGGFEDLDESDEESIDDDDDGAPRTKTGYVEDDFVVEDYEEEGGDFNTSDSSCEEEIEIDEDEDEDDQPVSARGYSTRSSTRNTPNTIFTELADDYESS